MRIENLRSTNAGGRARVSATVIWENTGRDDYEVYFETEGEFSENLSCNPNAFMLACAVPAMHYGEKRVFIDAEICPELREGLTVALGWLRNWFDKSIQLPIIEAKTISAYNPRDKPGRAGFFFSGGIDSFATLASNRANFPADHPRSIKDGLLVYGLEQDIPEIFELVKESLSVAASVVGITLVPVYTNLYLPYREEDSKNHWEFWWGRFMGAALASVAHTFASRYFEVSISPDYDIPHQVPHGSHPLIDPNYSSCELRIRHNGVAYSRFEKTRLIAEWGLPLDHLRVCNQYRRYEPGKFNCGVCEKCVRTMLALLTVNALPRSAAFEADDVSREMVAKISLEPSSIHFYEELLEPLRECGRSDLATEVQHKIAEYGFRQKICGIKTKVKQFDKKYLGNSLSRLRDH